jgi:hypothetical protein
MFHTQVRALGAPFDGCIDYIKRERLDGAVIVNATDDELTEIIAGMGSLSVVKRIKLRTALKDCVSSAKGASSARSASPSRGASSARSVTVSHATAKSKSDEPRFDTPADVDVVATFESMGLKQNLLRGIFEFGFEKPTAIQQRAIVPMISGRDVIAQAHSGTGKTAMFSISALQVVNVQSRDAQVLCLNPTRELAVQVIQCAHLFTFQPFCFKPKTLLTFPQISKVVSAIGDAMSIQAHPCIGGKSIGEDIRRLEAGVHIVSGTPGRVFDMIRRRNLRTEGIKLLLLDEVRLLRLLSL